MTGYEQIVKDLVDLLEATEQWRSDASSDLERFKAIAKIARKILNSADLGNNVTVEWVNPSIMLATRLDTNVIYLNADTYDSLVHFVDSLRKEKRFLPEA